MVLLVKTELDKYELNAVLKQMNLRFSKHYKNQNNSPVYYVTHCEGDTFQSSRDFKLEFDELKTISDYSKYLFIEFVE